MLEHLASNYGYLFLFGWIAAAGAGLPLPTTPVLLTAGLFAASNKLQLPFALIAAVAGAILSDTIWFYVGRIHGPAALRLLCRISMEPAACIRRAQDFMLRRPMVTLTFCKFIPGLSTLSSPVAGMSAMTFRRFLLLDGFGSTLWASTILAIGYGSQRLLLRQKYLPHWKTGVPWLLLLAAIVLLVVWRTLRRRHALRLLNTARIEPLELRRQLESGDKVFLVDLRHPMELQLAPFVIPGSVRLAPDDLPKMHQSIPQDCDIVLYCSCPNEATAAQTARVLGNLGITRIRALHGGFEEWKRLEYPLEEIAQEIGPNTINLSLIAINSAVEHPKTLVE